MRFRPQTEKLLAQSQRVQEEFLYLEVKIGYTLLQSALSTPPGANHYLALKQSIWKAIGTVYYFKDRVTDKNTRSDIEQHAKELEKSVRALLPN